LWDISLNDFTPLAGVLTKKSLKKKNKKKMKKEQILVRIVKHLTKTHSVQRTS